MSVRALRRLRAFAVLAAGGTLLAGCASAPDDAWILTPIRYSNVLDTGGGSGFIDVSYGMDVVADTAGGFWGASGGSWLHLDAEGRTLRRFNIPAESDLHGFAPMVALSPTVLLGTHDPVHLAGGWQLLAFDTEAMTVRVLADWPERRILDIALHDGRPYLLQYDSSERAVVVQWMDPVAEEEPAGIAAIVPVSGDMSRAALTVRPDGAIFIATSSERILLSPEGEVIDRQQATAPGPQVEANASGAVLRVGSDPAAEGAPIFIEGGSGEARGILERFRACEPDDLAVMVTEGSRLVLDPADGGPSLSFLCGAPRPAWVDEETFVFSVGGEGGGVLVRVTPPRNLRDAEGEG